MSDLIPEEREVRLQKLQQLRDMGINPYPAHTKRSLTLSEAATNFNALKKEQKTIAVTGRLMSKRTFGALAFGVLRDGTGDLQLIFRKDILPAAKFKMLQDLIDAGDFLQAKGTLVLSKTGEKSLEVKSFDVLTKALRALPEKWHGLSDVETRYRKRYLDLLVNPEARDRVLITHKVTQAIREILIRRGYIEVNTPVIQPLAGGALATPFKTYYEAIGAEAYMRIAPELYLKRLIIAGFDRVFEFARVFRNEGVSTHHLQDFTMLEFYEAYASYEELMKLTEELMVAAVKAVTGGSLELKIGGKSVNFRPPFPRITMRELIKKRTGIDIAQYDSADGLSKAIHDKGLKLVFKGKAGYGKLVDELYKETVRPTLVQPTFVIDHPVELSPLAKKHEKDPRTVERFQLIIGGWEVLNAFSELNDPIDQAERFNDQVKERKAGDKEAHAADDAFVEALEHGMPPTAGFGMGIERLVSVLTNAETIREAVAFPFVKPKG